MKPSDVPTKETAAFITSHSAAGAIIVEIGCGEGDVAAVLLDRGYKVTAVDADPGIIARVQERGIPAICATWPALQFDAADCIVFTRSLHHISPISAAMEKARQTLRPQGRLLVEDFAYQEADEKTIRWLLGVVQLAGERELLQRVPGEFVTDIAAASDPLEAWHSSHDHDLHSLATMTRSVADHFTLREDCAVPYLYRYLLPVLPDTTPAAEFLQEIFEEEARLGEKGEIVLIGRRIVASA